MARLTILGLAFAAAALAKPVSAGSDDVLARSIAAYRALKSYADTATVLNETGSPASPTTERQTFRTYFRAPRQYLFDWREEQASGGERFVIRGDDGAFRTWWSTSGVETEYPRGKGINAFLSSPQARLIASLIFPQSGMQSTITDLGDTTDEGFEQVGGRRCHKITGIAKSIYGATGHEHNFRRTTVWIDADTLLIRKVFEDTPRGYMRGSVSRHTATFEPHANPPLEDQVFRFVAPASQP